MTLAQLLVIASFLFGMISGVLVSYIVTAIILANKSKKANKAPKVKSKKYHLYEVNGAEIIFNLGGNYDTYEKLMIYFSPFTDLSAVAAMIRLKKLRKNPTFTGVLAGRVVVK